MARDSGPNGREIGEHDPMGRALELAAAVRTRTSPNPWVGCVIVTTDANEKLAPVHDRMPVVLPETAWGEWLDPDNHDTTRLGRLLVPAPSDEFVCYPVSKLVNKPENQGPELLEAVDEPEPALDLDA